MKLVEIKAWCDNPDHQRGTVPATVERRVRIDDNPAVTVDLCAECSEGLFVDLLRVLRQGTQEEPKTRTYKKRAPRQDADPEFTCPRCGHMSTGMKALIQHCRNQHQMGAAAVRASHAARASGGVVA